MLTVRQSLVKQSLRLREQIRRLDKASWVLTALREHDAAAELDERVERLWELWDVVEQLIMQNEVNSECRMMNAEFR